MECDGRTYHSALSVRDRDRIRQEILESLGWRGRIWRIWSTDWFRSPRQEADKLISFLEHLRKNWKPEYSYGNLWIEEGQPSSFNVLTRTSTTTDTSQQAPPVQSVEEDRKAVRSVLIDNEDDLEISVGDIVKYIDVSKPEDIHKVQITASKTDFSNGNRLIAEKTPLAQTLLGAVVGDEVILHLHPASRIFRIMDIKRS